MITKKTQKMHSLFITEAAYMVGSRQALNLNLIIHVVFYVNPAEVNCMVVFKIAEDCVDGPPDVSVWPGDWENNPILP